MIFIEGGSQVGKTTLAKNLNLNLSLVVFPVSYLSTITRWLESIDAN
ncbi:hypothetical protein [Rickettsia canadensis]|uniref:Uncharacterized protein n=1 Tax=Rickettsia canadensis str. CA410 TaxID=1105107 RepID=A0ABM5MV71_RICCA|nr:hypothetical protein [Rickettsia canadensis]AFB21593.1 hypothetical protein RCA_05250 [Rickettsia canadensis str. CA410]